MSSGLVTDLGGEMLVEKVLEPFHCFRFVNSHAFDLGCLQQILAIEVLLIVDKRAVSIEELL